MPSGSTGAQYTLDITSGTTVLGFLEAMFVNEMLGMLIKRTILFKQTEYVCNNIIHKRCFQQTSGVPNSQ